MRAWLRQWLIATGAVAVVATSADALLLQRRRGFFSGGFLATDYVAAVDQAIGFFAGSLLVDAAAAGIVVAAALWLAGRLQLDRRVAVAGAAIAALLPIAVADFIGYRMATFLGDAFDLVLMFDLAGRDPGEILAVSSEHLVPLAGIAGGALAAGTGAIWMLARVLRRGGTKRVVPVPRVTFRQALVVPVALLLAGTAGGAVLRSRSDVLDNGLRRKPTGHVLGAIVNVLSDVDRDGYGVAGRPPDPDLFDARIHPYAVEVPGNGIDEDGVAGDLPPGDTPLIAPAAATTPWQWKPDVVLVVLESFRGDAVGARVHGRPVTPVLDALAREGVSVEHAYSHNGYTVQSRRHIFTGALVDVPGLPTLVDDFKANGYETAYFSGQDDSFGGPAGSVGLERADVRYDARSDRDRRYSTFTTAGSLAVPYDVLVERVSEFLRARKGDRPLFLYVNFHDTHFPYHHRSIQPLLGTPVLAQSDIVPARSEELRGMYLNAVANVDRAIGEVVARARAALPSPPGVVVLSDHGESLFDEGFLGHGYALNEAQTRIPLVIANLPLSIPEPFGQADLRPSIHAALASVPVPGTRPVVVRDDSRIVFQYLGLLDRPSQIAFTTIAGRDIYDFREGRVLQDGRWIRPGQLGPTGLGRFRELVYAWERMAISRRGGGP